MPDKIELKQISLVPIKNAALTTRSSALVRRGLNHLKAIEETLADWVPLSLRVETEGGLTSIVIERKTPIPVQKTATFSTTYDMQRNFEFHVLQGEFPLGSENASLARFTVENIPPAPRGAHQIQVTFDVDINGILHVTAKDAVTQKPYSIRITEISPGLSENEIDKMLKDFNARTRKT